MTYLEARLSGTYHYTPLKTSEAVLSQLLPIKERQKKSMGNRSTHIGIEVEVENMPINPFTKCTTQLEKFTREVWAIHEDGSLRAPAMEFVSLPMKGSTVYQALVGLKQMLIDYVPEHSFSHRTGIHIHMNARNMSYEEVCNFLVVYIALEPVLFNFVGNDRINNIFCVPLFMTNLANKISRFLYAAINGQEVRMPFDAMLRECSKYMALNILPLRKFGTFEFRHMEGNMNVDFIFEWVNIILSINNYAKSHKLSDVVKTVTELNTNSHYLQFVQDVIGAKYALNVNVGMMEKSVTFLKDCLCSVPLRKIFHTTIPKETKFIKRGLEVGKFKIYKTDKIGAQLKQQLYSYCVVNKLVGGDVFSIVYDGKVITARLDVDGTVGVLNIDDPQVNIARWEAQQNIFLNQLAGNPAGGGLVQND